MNEEEVTFSKCDLELLLITKMTYLLVALGDVIRNGSLIIIYDVQLRD